MFNFSFTNRSEQLLSEEMRKHSISDEWATHAHTIFLFVTRFEWIRLFSLWWFNHTLLLSLLIRTIYRLIVSQPIYTQRLLVLLFGTFRVIASNSERAGTGMSSEAIGVSVAPSFFQSCVSDGKTARMEDVLRYKVNYVTKFLWSVYIGHDGSFSSNGNKLKPPSC